VASQHNQSAHRYLRVLFDAGTVAGLTDGQLLERFAAQRGETSELAVATLVERHGPMVLGVCRAILPCTCLPDPGWRPFARATRKTQLRANSQRPP
jgi:hypothetical protein